MYSVDEKDEVIELKEIPQSLVGAPMPIVLSDEHISMIAYYAQDEDIGPGGTGETIIVVSFTRCLAIMFIPPTEETFSGHPLASRGLKPYSAYLIKDSSWIRRLEKRNAAQSQQPPKLLEDHNHYVLSFQDSTFECIAGNYEFEIINGSMSDAIDMMKDKLKA